MRDQIVKIPEYLSNISEVTIDGKRTGDWGLSDGYWVYELNSESEIGKVDFSKKGVIESMRN